MSYVILTYELRSGRVAPTGKTLFSLDKGWCLDIAIGEGGGVPICNDGCFTLMPSLHIFECIHNPLIGNSPDNEVLYWHIGSIWHYMDFILGSMQDKVWFNWYSHTVPPGNIWTISKCMCVRSMVRLPACFCAFAFQHVNKQANFDKRTLSSCNFKKDWNIYIEKSLYLAQTSCVKRQMQIYLVLCTVGMCVYVIVSRLKETVLGADRDSLWLLGEETGQPLEVPLAAVAPEMTPLQVAMPTPPSRGSGKEGDGATESPYEEVRHRWCRLSTNLIRSSL